MKRFGICLLVVTASGCASDYPSPQEKAAATCFLNALQISGKIINPVVGRAGGDLVVKFKFRGENNELLDGSVLISKDSKHGDAPQYERDMDYPHTVDVDALLKEKCPAVPEQEGVTE